jgi:hypothetical protein
VLLRCWGPLRCQPGSAGQQRHLAGRRGLLPPLWHPALLLLLLVVEKVLLCLRVYVPLLLLLALLLAQ